MFKLLVLSALFALATARPSYLGGASLIHSVPQATIIEEPSYAKVGSIVKTIPTAVSHQSISQVHSGGHYVQPIVAPIYKTYAAPAIQTYAAPIATSYGHSYGVGHPLVGSSYGSYGAVTPVLKSYAPSYGSHYGGDYYGHGAW